MNSGGGNSNSLVLNLFLFSTDPTLEQGWGAVDFPTRHLTDRHKSRKLFEPCMNSFILKGTSWKGNH